MAIMHLFGDTSQIKRMHATANGLDNNGEHLTLQTDGHLRSNSNVDAETTVTRLKDAGFNAEIVDSDSRESDHNNIAIKAGEITACKPKL